MVLGTLVLVNVSLLLYLEHGLTFYLDEWRLLVGRRAWSVGVFLRPHNEHLFLVPVVVFKVLMAGVGLTHHWAFQIPLLFLHLACVAIVYLLARPRIGAWAALAAAVPILFFGSAWEDLLLPIQVSFLGSVAAGLGMLLMLDRPPTRRRDALASLLLALSIASSTLGLSFAAAALIEVLGRPHVRRRLWVVAAPLALYAVWFIAYGPTKLQQGGDVRTNIPFVPKYIAEAAAGAFGAITGLGLAWGRVLAVVGVLLLVRHLLRAGRVSPRLIALLAAALTYWGLAGLARAQLNDPAAVRYLYPGGVFIVLVAAEVLRSTNPTWRTACLLAGAVVFAVVANVNELRGGRDTLQQFSNTTRAQLAAVQVLGPRYVPADFIPAPVLAPGLHAGDYFDMIRELGSPVDVSHDLLQAGATYREEADAVLVRALVLKARRGGSVNPVARPPAVESVRSARADANGPCVRVHPTSSGATLDVTVRSPGFLVRTRGDNTAELSIRRFADQFLVALKSLPPSSTYSIRLPPPGPPQSWHVRVSARDPVEVCTAA